MPIKPTINSLSPDELNLFVRSIGAHIAMMSEGLGLETPLYAFLLFKPPDGDQTSGAHYISNAERADIIKAMRDTADRLESRMDKPAIGLDQPK